MIKNPLSVRWLKNLTFLSGFLLLSAPLGQAADTLNFFKNYFVTGDVIVAGVGLRSTGQPDGFGLGDIYIGVNNQQGVLQPGVPCTDASGIVPCSTAGAVPAQPIAAFLYWETEETVPDPASTDGFFNSNAIVGKLVGDQNNPACWSSSGPGGPPQAKGRVYRADVLRFLPIVTINSKKYRQPNFHHTVRLRDSGGNGNGNVKLTQGASLVIVYRIVVRGNPTIVPLRSVVAYDGAYTLKPGTLPFEQTIGGFYQAVTSDPTAKMIPIVANGGSGQAQTLTVTNATLNNSNDGTNPFFGILGERWDNPLIPITLTNAASYTTNVTTGNNQTCLTFASVWTSTKVVDIDNDGLLDTWETNGLHLNTGGPTPAQPATFGGCLDYPAEPCVDLHAMGADAAANHPDIFVEIDWLQSDPTVPSTYHVHTPKLDALSKVAASFLSNGFYLHFDVGNLYQGNSFIVPANLAKGGLITDENESTLECTGTMVTPDCPYPGQPVLSWKKGFLGVKNGFPNLNVQPHFDHNRKDIFHYALFAHALAGPFTNGVPNDTDPKSFSGVSDRPGGDLMVTLGLWLSDILADNQTGSVLTQAGALMHELGHNLDLSHAGKSRVPNCISNYFSVMNYLYQVRGLTDANGNEHIDYSNGFGGTLNESSLSEAGSYPYRARFFRPTFPTDQARATIHCDGTDITDNASFIRLENTNLSTPDWNGDGLKPADPPYSQDVSFNGSSVDAFSDSTDWTSLNLQQIGARANAFGLSVDVGVNDLSVLDSAQQDLGGDELGGSDGELGGSDGELGGSDGELGGSDGELGDIDYHNVISTLDPLDAKTPLTAATKFDLPLGARIQLGPWNGPGLGQIRAFDIYRKDDAHLDFVKIDTVNATIPPTPRSYNDVVDDFVHAGATCPVGVYLNPTTCFNTKYTYYIQ